MNGRFAPLPSRSPVTARDLAFRNALDEKLQGMVRYAASSGRLLVVAGTRDATDVATQIAATRPDVVTVLSESGAPEGHIFPGWVAGQVARNLSPEVLSFSDAIDALTKQERSHFDHLHEWLNFTTPDPVICPGGPPGSVGKHYTFGAVPCPNHQ